MKGLLLSELKINETYRCILSLKKVLIVSSKEVAGSKGKDWRHLVRGKVYLDESESFRVDDIHDGQLMQMESEEDKMNNMFRRATSAIGLATVDNILNSNED